MRTKNLIPVGQGCRRLGIGVKQYGSDAGMRCRCHPEKYLLVCKGCWELFHSDMPHAKTCSQRCRTRLCRSKNDKLLQKVFEFASGKVTANV